MHREDGLINDRQSLNKPSESLISDGIDMTWVPVVESQTDTACIHQHHLHARNYILGELEEAKPFASGLTGWQ